MNARTSGGHGLIQGLEPQVRGLILDGDGVLWRDTEPIGNLPAVFGAIRGLGLRVFLATNNAMHGAEHYRTKLHSLGVDLDAADIVTSAEATAEVIQASFPHGGPVFMIGERGLAQALALRGFDVVSDPGEGDTAVAVVVGMDREFSYAKLQRACRLIQAGVPFYGTNADATYPTLTGVIPGAGAILAAVETATGVNPTLIGKPSDRLFDIGARRMHLSPSEILVVGDRLETDIRGGQAFGARTALVLTGVSTAAQAARGQPAPTIVASSLAELVGA